MGKEGGERKEIEEGEKGKEVLVLDTPERSRNQISTPVSRFEESPVFNFLNNLSPIKPVKSVHITQTLNALSFTSLPSVFTSPHASSLKESRFFRRRQFVDPSKPEFSADLQKKTDGNEGIMKCAHNSSERQEDFKESSIVETSYDCSQLAVEFVQCLNYDCNSPITSPRASCGGSNNGPPEFDANAGTLVPFSLVASGKGFLANASGTEELSQTNQSRDAAGCDWDSLMSDAADLLNFDTPKDVDSLNKSQQSETGFFNNNPSNTQNMQTFGCCEHQGQGNECENPSTQPGEESGMMEFAETNELIASSLNSECMEVALRQNMHTEPVSNLYRGMRRRCLVFEMAGARRKQLEENSSSVSSSLLHSDGNTPSTEKQLVPYKAGNDSSRCIFPGIGLHLNALATTPKEFNAVKQDASVSGRVVIAPGSTANFQPIMTGQESFNESSALTATEICMDSLENTAPINEDANELALVVHEEFSQISPKKKRRRLEVSGEPEGCKRCNCKKSKCLKLYCECFAAGVYCVEPCSCQECFNKPIHEDTVLATRKQIESRNPLAFAPKVIRSSDSLTEDDSSKTPASARHKRGCNCKKSGCLKKYCECYQGGVGCSINCRCEGCKNAFGRKDGSIYITTEAELDEDETDAVVTSVKNRKAHKTAIHVEAEQQNPESAPPATPLRFGRPSVQLPFSSKKKPPRSSLPLFGSSSGLYAGQGIVKPNILRSAPKFDKHFETVQEDELPEVLQGNGSPTGLIKSGSPNSKRVSPPHCDFGTSSPGRRSSRKLILQSIPAFPSLTPKH